MSTEEKEPEDKPKKDLSSEKEKLREQVRKMIQEKGFREGDPKPDDEIVV